MKLIDKDAVLAIIEKRKQRINPKRTDYTDGQKSELVNLSLEINALEVKEVDLDKPLGEVKIHTSMESGSLDEVILTTKYIAKKGE